MFRLLFALSIAFLFHACSTGGSPPPRAGEESVVVEGDTAIRVDRYLSMLADSGYSTSVLVAVNDRVILRKGYGLANDSLQLPVTPATVFTIGSITKQFTGAAILKLEMEGKVSVEDSITRYFADVPEDKRGITLHHLLTHSAGFPGAIGDDADPTGTDDFLALAMGTPLRFAPGTAYDYSNVGYSLLGIIIEQVSGQSYEAYLREKLFLPAGMYRTGYLLPGWKPGELAHGYRNGRDWGTLPDRPWLADGPGWHLRANGGILSTAGDMFRWHEALLGEDILSAGAKAKYYYPHIEEGEGAGTYYGYGWAIFPTPRGTQLITHNGGNGIFFAEVLRYPEERIFVFLATNRSRRGYNQAAFQVGRVVLDPDFVPPPPAAPGIERTSLPDDTRGAALGRLLAVIRSGDEVDIRAFFADFVAEDFANMAPMEEHLRIFRQMHGEMGNANLQKVLDSGTEVELSLLTPAGQVFRLRTQFDPGTPGKVAGIGVEAE